MKHTIKKIVRFTLEVALALATLLFFMILFARTEEVTALLAETMTYVVFELILSKVGIGIIAFMLGAIIVMALGGNRQAKAETEIAYLRNELSETKAKLAEYKAREATQNHEQIERNKTRAENGLAIIKAIS